MRCGINLKQLRLAVYNFHDTYLRLPPGGAEDQSPFGTDTTSTNGQQWGSSWMVYILLGIEQNAIAAKRQDYGIAGAVNGLIPSYTESRISTLPNGGQISGGGMMFPNGKVNFAAVTDGLSNTMMLSEQSNFLKDTAGVKQDWRASQPWGFSLGVKGQGVPPSFDNAGGDNRSPGMCTIRYTINQSPVAGWANDVSGTGVGINGNFTGANIPLNATHTGGVNVALGDGSIRFLTDSTTLAILAAVATRDDGTVANLP